jgi:hypothetical protein
MRSRNAANAHDRSEIVQALKRAAELETDPAAKEAAWLRYYDAAERHTSGEPNDELIPESSTRLNARFAFESGDQLFQVSFDLISVQGHVATLASNESAGAYSTTSEFNVNEALNEIVLEGWFLHSMSTSYVHEREVSRDKFWSSGEQTASTGRLVGTYVFARDDDTDGTED